MIAPSQRRRVVVTGVGVINPLGNDIETVWSALKEGKSGVGYTTIFDASKFPTKISAEIKNWDVSQAGEDLENGSSADGTPALLPALRVRLLIPLALEIRSRTAVDSASTWEAAKAIRISILLRR